MRYGGRYSSFHRETACRRCCNQLSKFAKNSIYCQVPVPVVSYPATFNRILLGHNNIFIIFIIDILPGVGKVIRKFVGNDLETETGKGAENRAGLPIPARA